LSASYSSWAAVARSRASSRAAPRRSISAWAAAARERAAQAAEPGQALAPVGDGAGGVLQAPLLLRQLALELGPVGDRVVQGAPGRLQGGLQFGLLFADAGGLAFQVLRVPAGPLLHRRRHGALHARVGQRDGAAHPLRELGQLVPGLLGALEARGEAAHLLLQPGLALESPVELPRGGLPAFLQRRLVGDLGLERLAQPYEVVGEQAEPGIAQVGLDDGGPARHRRLAAQRLELPAQLVREVLHTREVGLHRVQLPQRLLLALAVLEDTGGLLDEGAAAHRVGVQDGVELALADDDVHLPADTGVGQQFLDVQQTAGVTVDLVLAAAVAEHRPRDGDLGVLDGQGPVGVVDGQGDLGAAQGRAARGAGEDDVLHLAAAQRLCALFAHDPAQRVHDIGLARAVRADHAGDPRFEPERGRRGERLEPAQGQGLQVHAGGLYLPGVSRSMNRRPPAVSPINAQGTPDVKTLKGCAGKRRRRGRGAGGKKEGTPEASLATLRTERVYGQPDHCWCRGAMQ
jgi:hypothetical protein